MIVLLVDVGNTRIKLGWTRLGTAQREAQALALPHGDLSELSAWLRALPCKPSIALGVNVASPKTAQGLEYALQANGPLPVRWMASEAYAAGVRNDYDPPGQLGADRWLSMIGLAQSAFRVGDGIAPDRPAMLASFGTATTIDTLGPEWRTERNAASSPEGQRPNENTLVATSSTYRVFHGGLIFPGPALMRSSLSAGTANLPDADGITAPYPTYTHQAIMTGIAAAQAGAMLRQWREGLERFGASPRVYSTGGGWPIIEDEAQRLLARAQQDQGLPLEPIKCLPAPVLDGLCRMAHDMKKTTAA
jgi:type III pantothenate kinase